MVIFRITLSVSGDSFYPSKILGEIKNDFNIIDYNNPSDFINPKNRLNTYGFGSMDIVNPKQYAMNYSDNTYEDYYVNFLEKKYALLEKENVEELQFILDVFYVDQCFIEVLNMNFLKFLGEKVQIPYSIPLNVYKLNSTQECIEMLLDSGYKYEEIMNNYEL